jgi:hypothetical protein
MLGTSIRISHYDKLLSKTPKKTERQGVDSGLIRCIVVLIYGGSRPHHDQYFMGDGFPYDEAKHSRAKETSMRPPKMR